MGGATKMFSTTSQKTDMPASFVVKCFLAQQTLQDICEHTQGSNRINASIVRDHFLFLLIYKDMLEIFTIKRSHSNVHFVIGALDNKQIWTDILRSTKHARTHLRLSTVRNQ